MISLASKFPTLTLTVHVDDFGAAALGQHMEVVNTLAEAGSTLKAILNQDLEVELAQDKALIVATSPGLAAAINALMNGLAGCYVHSAKRLGIDHAFSEKGKGMLPVHRARMQAGKLKIKLMQRHRKQGGGPKVFFAGM